jgi:hypothetical protein
MRHRSSSAVLLAVGLLTLVGMASRPGGAADLNGTPVPSFEVASLPAEQWSKLHAGVFPPAEKWTEIPWETDVTAARRRAAREGKPLFLWIMDGHPLGCT